MARTRRRSRAGLSARARHREFDAFLPRSSATFDALFSRHRSGPSGARLHLKTSRRHGLVFERYGRWPRAVTARTRCDAEARGGTLGGAAILCRACLDGRLHPAEVISLNGALLPLSGFKHPAVTPFVRAIASSDWVSRFFARRLESPREVSRMLAATGSVIDATGMELYGRLSRSPSHAGAALTMMAVWDVRPLERELSRLEVPLTLVVGARDRMILPGEAARVQRLLPSAEVVQFGELGHLSHEERPDFIADLIVERARSRGVLIPS